MIWDESTIKIKEYDDLLDINSPVNDDRNCTVNSGEYVTLWLKHVAL
jgi:hypothetical protein